jgi:hypothetical protein
MSSHHLYRLCHSCFKATKSAKQAVRDAIWKEWERLKKSRDDRFALLWNNFSGGLIDHNKYQRKRKELEIWMKLVMKDTRERRSAGKVKVLMNEAVSCVHVRWWSEGLCALVSQFFSTLGGSSA